VASSESQPRYWSVTLPNEIMRHFLAFWLVPFIFLYFIIFWQDVCSAAGQINATGWESTWKEVKIPSEL